MMTVDMSNKLRRSLIKHESYRKFPYTDSVGKLSIGIGYNISDRGMTDEWINTQYDQDVKFFYDQLSSSFTWFSSLNIDRQIVLIDLAFNLGWKHFLEFKEMLGALSIGDFKQASFQMLQSKWAEQVKSRAAELAQGMLTGEYNV